jgi:hypothetical protein
VVVDAVSVVVVAVNVVVVLQSVPLTVNDVGIELVTLFQVPLNPMPV